MSGPVPNVTFGNGNVAVAIPLLLDELDEVLLDEVLVDAVLLDDVLLLDDALLLDELDDALVVPVSVDVLVDPLELDPAVAPPAPSPRLMALAAPHATGPAPETPMTMTTVRYVEARMKAPPRR
jgi:hypothetical protein